MGRGTLHTAYIHVETDLDEQGNLIFAANKRDLKLLCINRQTDDTTAVAKMNDKAYALCVLDDGRICAIEKAGRHPKRALVVYASKKGQQLLYEAVSQLVFPKKTVSCKTCDLHVVNAEAEVTIMLATFNCHHATFSVQLTGRDTEGVGLGMKKTRLEDRVRRSTINKALRQIVVSFVGGQVVLYKYSGSGALTPLRRFNASQLEVRPERQHPSLWCRQAKLNNVVLTQMGVVIASGCMTFDDPDLVEDESRHGLFWFDFNTDSIKPKQVRKPTDTDDVALANMFYVDKWKRLFVYDVKHQSLAEYALEFRYQRQAAGEKTLLFQKIQQVAELQEQGCSTT